MVNYDINRQTKVYLYHGPIGFAATVTQKYVDKDSGEEINRPMHIISRVLTSTEERYGQVEGESLQYCSGLNLTKCISMEQSLKFLWIISH